MPNHDVDVSNGSSRIQNSLYLCSKKYELDLPFAKFGIELTAFRWRALFWVFIRVNPNYQKRLISVDNSKDNKIYYHRFLIN